MVFGTLYICMAQSLKYIVTKPQGTWMIFAQEFRLHMSHTLFDNYTSNGSVARILIPLQVQVNSQFSYFSTNFGFSDSVYQNAMCNEIVKHPDNTCHLDLIG